MTIGHRSSVAFERRSKWTRSGCGNNTSLFCRHSASISLQQKVGGEKGRSIGLPADGKFVCKPLPPPFGVASVGRLRVDLLDLIAPPMHGCCVDLPPPSCWHACPIEEDGDTTDAAAFECHLRYLVCQSQSVALAASRSLGPGGNT